MTPCMTDSAGLDDLAGLDAAGADVEALRCPVDAGAHPLDVRVPPPLGAAMRVRHRHPPRRALATHFTFRCHWSLLQCNRADRCDHDDEVPPTSPPAATAIRCYQDDRMTPRCTGRRDGRHEGRRGPMWAVAS